MFAYASANPLARVDPRGLEDIFLGVEGDVALFVGWTQGFGLYVDTDDLRNSGLYNTGGVAVGASVGLSGVVGVCDDISTGADEIDINLAKWGAGFQGIFGDIVGDRTANGRPDFSGLSVTVGPGAGVSVNFTETDTFTVRDLVDFVDDVIGLPDE